MPFPAYTFAGSRNWCKDTFSYSSFWKQNQMLHGRPLLVCECWTAMKFIQLVNSVSRKLTFYIWASSVCIVFSWRYHYVGIWSHTLLKLLFLRKSSSCVLWPSCCALNFIEYSDSPVTHTGWINSWLPNTNKMPPTVQALSVEMRIHFKLPEDQFEQLEVVRASTCACMHTCTRSHSPTSHTYRHNTRNHFFFFVIKGVENM